MFYTDIADLKQHKAKYSKWDLSVREQRDYRIPVFTEWILMEETKKTNTLKTNQDFVEPLYLRH